MTEDAIRPFYAMEILSRAQAMETQCREVCHLEIGEPARSPAPRVIETVRQGLCEPQRYTAAKGSRALRERLAGHYQDRHGVRIDPERIIITMGSSSGFILSFLAGFKAGAKIAVTRPGYPAYLNIIASLHLGAVEIPVTAAAQWRLTAADIEAAYAREPFEGLLFASPANPTGAVVDRKAMTEIVKCCEKLGVTLISDEIYHGLNYAGEDVSALEISDAPVVVNSFSKYFCMTGWRIGWLVLPETLIRRAEMMAQSLFISAASVSQMGALAALDERVYYDEQRDYYADNRLALADGLQQLGFGGAAPSDGAFYAYVDASRFTNDTMEFCKQMLEQAGVAATPGVDFDRVDGQHYVRFSYASSREVIDKALERMGAFLG
jgi:aspartate/methionine/tyrosine aminotransferase